ncbi:MAG: ribbon-helix-helix protein, CopG family [Proteobacteria bacterium]|nr:ribbon-helix-helix protein, CopG family [Pseudomonadota bacterium]
MVGKVASVRMEEEKLQRIDKLAKTTNRSRGWLINQAVDRYLEYEEWLLKAIEAGMEDIEAGRIISHEKLKKDWENKLERSMD